MAVNIAPILSAPSAWDDDRQVVTLYRADEKLRSQQRVFIAKNTQIAKLQTQDMFNNWNDVPNMRVNYARAQAFDNIIAKSFLKDQHRNVLTQNAQWKTFYHLRLRALLYINQSGGVVAKPAESTVPCYDCGVVLRVANIHIDHQRPQEGNEFEPICKVFRAMGLTIDGPRDASTKGATWSVAWATSVGGLASQGGGLPSKYTLNGMGKIYYTLAQWYGAPQELKDLEVACMNHIVNLRPLCSACNTRNRNPIRFDYG